MFEQTVIVSAFLCFLQLAISHSKYLEPNPGIPWTLESTRLADRKCMEYIELLNPNIPPDPLTKNQSLFGGIENILPMDFRHLAQIGFGPLNDIQWKCGGAVISRRYILTAAHCVSTANGDYPTYVKIGNLFSDGKTNVANTETIGISDVIFHPNYTIEFKYNDIALLRLPITINFNNYVRPACLNTALNIPETSAIAFGWSYRESYGLWTKELSKTTLNLESYENCKRNYSSKRTLPNGILKDQHICVGLIENSYGYCISDGGSPLQVHHEQNDRMYKIIGVLSFANSCGFKRIPEVYTRVSNYIDWIDEIAFSHG